MDTRWFTCLWPNIRIEITVDVVLSSYLVIVHRHTHIYARSIMSFPLAQLLFSFSFAWSRAVAYFFWQCSGLYTFEISYCKFGFCFALLCSLFIWYRSFIPLISIKLIPFCSIFFSRCVCTNVHRSGSGKNQQQHGSEIHFNTFTCDIIRCVCTVCVSLARVLTKLKTFLFRITCSATNSWYWME